MKSLTHAVDYDDTFTADPAYYAKCILWGIECGHSYFCVTARRNTPENHEKLQRHFGEYGIKMPIIFCNLKSKFDTMESMGLKVDIWWDDSPHAIVHGV